MTTQFARTEMLLGSSAVEKLKNSSVAVFGVGGVGGYVAEALARSGVGRITLIDNDKVSITNLNRQIIALHSTLGRFKTEVMAERIKDINPEAEVTAINAFYLPDNADDFPLSGYDYVADAVDTVAAKLELICRAKAAGVKIISAMGAGNKKNPLAFKVADISETSGCPLARVIRRELKKRGVTGVKTVFSAEEPVNTGERTPASVAYMPSVAGLIMAAEIIKDLTEEQ